MKIKFNDIKLGLFLGVLVPFISLLLFYIIKYPTLELKEFLKLTKYAGILTKILSLCVIPNLLMFFIFIWLDKLFSARGVLFSTMVCTLFIFAIKIIL